MRLEAVICSEVFHLDGALERDVLTEIATQMVIQRALVDLLMVVALADIVEDALHEQADEVDHDEHRDERTTDEDLDGDAGDAEAALLVGSLDDDGTEEGANKATCAKVGDD